MDSEQNNVNSTRVDEASMTEASSPLYTDSHSNVLAVFVVQFDVHKGNVVEWQYPADFHLEGVEYQAICSGLHRIESDIIYFSRQNLYGISVFQNIPTDIERGAHMKAIGIIVQPTKNTGLCGEVWTHEKFLRKELSNHMVISETIEPTRYDALLNYYTQHQYRVDQEDINDDFPRIFNFPDLNQHSVNYNLKHNVAKDLFNKGGEEFGVDSLTDFVNKFGPDVFVLWKAALLRKRIMLVNMPPMELTCKYVYNIHLLGKVPAQFQAKGGLVPKFTVGVNDIPEIEGKGHTSYVACTPDSIFQIKSDLYDLIITLPQPEFHHPIKSSITNKASSGIALSDFNPGSSTSQQQQQQNLPTTPQFKSTTQDRPLATRHNPADFTRFRIMWKQLLSSSSASWAQFVASEPTDILGTTGALVTGIYYWLYEETSASVPPLERRGIFSSWQDLFAGGAGANQQQCRSNSSQLPIYLNQTSSSNAEETQNLLLDEDEQDAMEINNNEVFEVVAARASAELPSRDHVDVIIKEDNEVLLGFFHSLTYYLLSTLQTILSINEEEGCNILSLYPKDLVQLGLDPQTDVDFVTELAQLYFKKRVQVHGIHNLQACLSSSSAAGACCCCSSNKRRSNGGVGSGNGAIRI